MLPVAGVTEAVADETETSGSVLECPENSAFSQPPGEVMAVPGWSNEMDSLRSYDNFSGVSDPIAGLVWWGGDQVAGEACVPESDTFEVAFYLDNYGQPGELAAWQNVAPIAVPTELDQGLGKLNRYEVTFDTPVELASGWVSAYRRGFSGCFFYWATGTGGTDTLT